MSYNRDLLAAAQRYGREFGVDPALLIATTIVESGGRLDAVGDGGHSFGPYQMNTQGRLATTGFSRQQAMDPWLSTREAAREFAATARKYGVSGARLASDAQRPADRAGYQRKIAAALPAAQAYLRGAGGGSTAGLLNAPVESAAGSSSPAPLPAAPQDERVRVDDGTMLRLMKWVNDSERDARAGRELDLPEGVLEAVAAARVRANQARLQNQAGGASSPAQEHSPGDGHDHSSGGQPLVQDPATGKFRLVGKPIDRPGMPTSSRVIDFMNRVAGYYGANIQAGTGSQHNRMTTSGNVSAHWSGNALDLPARGDALIRMGRAALRAAGYQNWQNAPGGLYNLPGHQIIFGVNWGSRSGGDHTDHLHAALR